MLFQTLVWALLAYGINMLMFDVARWLGIVSLADLHSWWFGLITFFSAIFLSAWMLAIVEEHRDPISHFELCGNHRFARHATKREQGIRNRGGTTESVARRAPSNASA